MTEPLADNEQQRLLALAKDAVVAAASGQGVPLDLTREPAALRVPGAAFVTLRRSNGELRGCIGSVQPIKPLAEDVTTNAIGAALRDPRFRPVTPDEAPSLHVSVAVLSPFTPIDAKGEDALVRSLRPGVDGLLLRDRGRRALFLPQVWDQLPDPAAFVGALKRKAGLPAGPLSPTFEAERFTVQPIGK